MAFEPLPLEVGELYIYQPLVIDACGPRVPDIDKLESSRFVCMEGRGISDCEGCIHYVT